MSDYERPSTLEKISVAFGLGMTALLFYGIATHGPRNLGTYFYGTITILLLLFAAFFTYPENYWPKSLIFELNTNTSTENSNTTS